jgi:hypothetical protein
MKEDCWNILAVRNGRNVAPESRGQYHQVPENHSPQFGQRQRLTRVPLTTSIAIHRKAATNPGVKVWKSFIEATAMPKHTGT